MNSRNIDNNDYNHVLDVLDKRSRSVKRTIIALIYFVISMGTLVALVAYTVNKNPSSPLAKTIGATIDSNEQEDLSQFFKHVANLRKKMSDHEAVKNNEQGSKGSIKATTLNQEELDKEIISKGADSTWYLAPSKSNSEKIAESIAAIIISFSVLMFIGFVMRAMLVFIKYYMQLGTDFENQKIAFMLSKGEGEKFTKCLSALREHNISFEKTPSLPQEKIIDKVIELTKSVKGDTTKT